MQNFGSGIKGIKSGAQDPSWAIDKDGNAYFAGAVSVASLTSSSGSVSVGSLSLTGNLSVAGTSSLTGAVSVAGSGVSGVTLYVANTTGTDPRGFMSAQYSTDTNGARVHLRKARGTEATPVVIVTGDTLGRIIASGYDGDTYEQMASIDFVSTGTIADGRVPTTIVFKTATDASPSVLTTALTLGANQVATFASTVSAVGYATGTGAPTTSIPIQGISSVAGAVTWEVRNTNSGTSASASVRASNASGAEILLQALGTGFTTSGMAIQDGGRVVTDSTLSGGLVIGPLGSNTLQFGTNNVLRLILAADGTSFSPVTDNVTVLGSATVRYANLFGTQHTTQGANGQASNIKQATTTVAAVTAATITATSLIPAGSLVIGIDMRITTTFDNSSGLTTINIGDGTDADRWGAAIARTSGTTTTLANITITSPVYYAAATNVVLTAVAGTFNVAAGSARLTVHYIDLTAATS